MLVLMLQLALAVVSLTSCASSTSFRNVPTVVELLPEISLSSQRVLYGVPQLFCAVQLQPGSVYDIKVSYPATQPSLFTLQVEQVLLPLSLLDSNDAMDEINVHIARKTIVPRRAMPPQHRALNTVKLRLRPDKVQVHESVRYRLEPSGTVAEVEFSLLAEVEGVRRPDSTVEMKECVFDIVVEEVLLEAFPRHTLVLIGWLVVLLFVSGKWLRPYLEKKIALGCIEDRVEATPTKDF